MKKKPNPQTSSDRRKAVPNSVPRITRPSGPGQATAQTPATHDHRRAVQNQQEAANEELHSLSEEMQSSNEELQRINEELETSKEELESTDKELSRLNGELGRRNAELQRFNSDLREARNFAQSVVESVPALLILDEEFRVQAANESFCQTFRVARRQAENRFVFDLANSQWNIPALRTLLEGVLARNSPFKDFEMTQEFENLGRRSILLAGRRVGDRQRILLTFEDITDRLKIQAAVRISELRYRRLFEAAKDGIIILDPHSRKITDINPFMSDLLGYAQAELLGKELWEIGLWKDHEASQAAFQELQEKGFIRYEDLPLQTKTGERRDVEFVSNLYQEGDRNVIQCNVRDITERKEAKAALRQSGERFRFMAESVSQKIFTAKPNGDVGYFNQQWVDFTGLPFEQIKSSGWTQFIHPDDFEENVRRWRHSIETGEPFQSQPRLRREDGVYRWHLTEAHAMRDGNGKVLMWIGSNTDIDDFKRAMEELRETKEKLSRQAAELNRLVEGRSFVQQGGG